MLERADHWTPPDSLGYSSLRPVRLTGLGRALVVLAAATLLGGVTAGVLLDRSARRQAAELRLLNTQGQPIDAVITRLWRRSQEQGQARHHVAYSFEYAGRQYQHSLQVPAKIWRELKLDAIFPVRFVPSQPSISHPTAWSAKLPQRWVPIPVAIALAVCSLAVLFPLRCQMRLLTEGRPAPGRVTGIKKADQMLIVKYEFRLLSGALAKGKASMSKAPAEAAPLCVLYDPENPRRNALYPLSLVRLENAPSRGVRQTIALRRLSLFRR